MSAAFIPPSELLGNRLRENRAALTGRVMRPCAQSGCRELVERGRCVKHQRSYELGRGKTNDRGYDTAYERLRVECFERDAWRCVDCGWEPDIVRMSREAGIGVPPRHFVQNELRVRYHARERHLHADHQIPIEQAPDLRLDLANLRTRCDVCHKEKHVRNGEIPPRSPRLTSALPHSA